MSANFLCNLLTDLRTDLLQEHSIITLDPRFDFKTVDDDFAQIFEGDFKMVADNIDLSEGLGVVASSSRRQSAQAG